MPRSPRPACIPVQPAGPRSPEESPTSGGHDEEFNSRAVLLEHVQVKDGAGHFYMGTPALHRPTTPREIVDAALLRGSPVSPAALALAQRDEQARQDRIATMKRKPGAGRKPAIKTQYALAADRFRTLHHRLVVLPARRVGAARVDGDLALIGQLFDELCADGTPRHKIRAEIQKHMDKAKRPKLDITTIGRKLRKLGKW